MATTHENRTLIVDFGDADRYQQLITDGSAFIHFITLFTYLTQQALNRLKLQGTQNIAGN